MVESPRDVAQPLVQVDVCLRRRRRTLIATVSLYQRHTGALPLSRTYPDESNLRVLLYELVHREHFAALRERVARHEELHAQHAVQYDALLARKRELVPAVCRAPPFAPAAAVFVRMLNIKWTMKVRI